MFACTKGAEFFCCFFFLVLKKCGPSKFECTKGAEFLFSSFEKNVDPVCLSVQRVLHFHFPVRKKCVPSMFECT